MGTGGRAGRADEVRPAERIRAPAPAQTPLAHRRPRLREARGHESPTWRRRDSPRDGRPSSLAPIPAARLPGRPLLPVPGHATPTPGSVASPFPAPQHLVSSPGVPAPRPPSLMGERSALLRRPAHSGPRPGLRGAAHPFAPQRRPMGPPPRAVPAAPAPACPPPRGHAGTGAAQPSRSRAGSNPNAERPLRRPLAVGRADPGAPTRWRGAPGTWLPGRRGRDRGSRRRSARLRRARTPGRHAPKLREPPARPAAPGGSASLSPRAWAPLSAGRWA